MPMIYRGRVVDFLVEEVHLPNGRTVSFEMVRHPGAAAVVPMRDDGRVVLIRQHRHAAGGMIYEIPAGRIDPGETPMECAKRELAEETGWRAARWDSLGMIWTTPGFTDEKIHLFLARGLEPAPRSLEPDEIIELEERSMEDAIGMIRRGEINDGKTICALMRAYFEIKDGSLQ